MFATGRSVVGRVVDAVEICTILGIIVGPCRLCWLLLIRDTGTNADIDQPAPPRLYSAHRLPDSLGGCPIRLFCILECGDDVGQRLVLGGD